MFVLREGMTNNHHLVWVSIAAAGFQNKVTHCEKLVACRRLVKLTLPWSPKLFLHFSGYSKMKPSFFRDPVFVVLQSVGQVEVPPFHFPG